MESEANLPTADTLCEYWLKKARNNPGSAVYLLGKEILKNANDGKDPDEVTLKAFKQLWAQSQTAIISKTTLELAGCRQTAALSLATNQLHDWTIKPLAYRQAHPLSTLDAKLEPMEKRYIGPMGDGPGWNG